MNNLSNDRLKGIIESAVSQERIAMARELLAYREAQSEPIGIIRQVCGNKTLVWANDAPEGTVLYSAPQLPAVLDKMTHEQRDILIKTAQVMFDREPTSDYSANIREVARIALASLNPDEPTDDERIMAIEEIIPAVDNVNSPVIPDGWIAAINRLLDSDGSRGCFSAIRCYDAHQEIEAMLAAAPKPGGVNG